MHLAPGTRLGPYEVLAPLGAGGMGEVYRARDSRLGREIALKTLPRDVAADPERLARFESEARAVAALSHPNVLALHDLGHEAGVAFAVTELIEGQTIRERLLDGPFAPTRAAAIAAQVAHGLAAAHDRGVIHRDLKPENVMVTPEGRVKILDFGLARREPGPEAGSQSLAPTAVASTQPGTVLGTTGYMAPEQVRGQVADARSDLFAFGILLYEMLTGRPPFRGASAADTMTAILREDPAPLSLAAPDTPAGLQRIVERCLEKHPAARFRTAADLAFALEALASGGSSGAHASHAAAGAGVRFQRLTFRNGNIAHARFTPDGASVVYGAAWDGRTHEIFTSRVGSPESRGLGLPAGSLLAMSAGGEMAVALDYRHFSWFQVRGTLARVALAGGGVRPLQKDVGCADWSPDGRTMAVIRYRDARCLLEYPPGRVLRETSDWLHRCRVSPDGAHVAFGHHHRTGEGEADLCVADRDGRVRVLASDLTNLSGLAWSPSGREVWFSGIDGAQRSGLWAAALDGGVRDLHLSATRISLHDVRADGRALVSFDTLRTGLRVGSPGGGTESDLSWFDGSVAAALSHDGERLLFSEVAEAENPHYACYLRGLDGSPAIRLGEGIALALSANEEWVLAATHHGRRGLVRYPTGFGDTREIALTGVGRPVWATFAADADHLLVIGESADAPASLFLAGVDGAPAERLWPEALAYDRFSGLPVSPDRSRLVLRPAGGDPVLFDWRTRATMPLTGVRPGESLLGFDAAGRGLHVCTEDARSRSVDVEWLDPASGERRPWARPTLNDDNGVLYVTLPVVATGGTRYAYSYLRVISNLHLVEGLGE